MSILRISNLKKSYANFSLEIDHLQIHKGKIYALIGQNGAGKTTLIRSIMNLCSYGGAVYICEKDVKQEKTVLKSVGFVSDHSNLNREMTISQYLKIMPLLYGDWDTQLFKELTVRFNLQNHDNTLIGNLSKGTYVKFIIAFAIAHHPRLYILDEPTSGLDPVVRVEVINSIKEFSIKDNAAVLFSTHIIEDMQDIADEVLLIKHGRLVMNRSLSEIIEKESDAREYILSRIN